MLIDKAKEQVGTKYPTPDYTYEVTKKPDTTKAGDFVAEVVVKDKDGKVVETVKIPVKVWDNTPQKPEGKPTQAELNKVTLVDNSPVLIKQGNAENGRADADIIAKVNAPGAAKLEVISRPTDTLGKKTATVLVTYPDGSTSTIEVPVEVHYAENGELDAPVEKPEYKGSETGTQTPTDNLKDQKEKAKSEIDKAAQNKKSEIDKDSSLTDQQKEMLKAEVDRIANEAKAEVDKATTKEQIAELVEAAKNSISEVKLISGAPGNKDNENMDAPQSGILSSTGATTTTTYALGTLGLLGAAALRRKKNQK